MRVVVLLLVLICEPTVLRAQDISKIDLKAPPSCPEVLKSCNVLVGAQKELISQLNANAKAYKKNLEAQSDPIIPRWVVDGAALVVGFAAGYVVFRR